MAELSTASQHSTPARRRTRSACVQQWAASGHRPARPLRHKGRPGAVPPDPARPRRQSSVCVSVQSSQITAGASGLKRGRAPSTAPRTRQCLPLRQLGATKSVCMHGPPQQPAPPRVTAVAVSWCSSRFTNPGFLHFTVERFTAYSVIYRHTSPRPWRPSTQTHPV